MRLMITVVGLAFLAGGCAQAPAEVFPVTSFETQGDLQAWEIQGQSALSDEWASDGKQSLKLTFDQGKGLLLNRSALPGDWSQYELLKVDVYNTGPQFSVTLRTDDADGATISSWYHPVRSGASTLDFHVRGLAEKIDVSRIQMAHLRIDPPVERPLEWFVDNLRFTVGEPTEEAKVEVPPEVAPISERPGNLLANADFELGFQHWGSWGMWDGGQYEFGTASGENAHSGRYSAAVICNKLGRGGIFCAPITIPADGSYTYSFWVKASEPSAIRFGGSVGGDHFWDEQVGAEWQRVERVLDFAAGDEGRMYLMSIGPGVVYFDEVTLAGKTPPTQQATGAATGPAQVEVRGTTLYVNGKPFFPIGIYRASPEDLKGTSFNCIPGWDQADAATLDACLEAGVYMMPDLTGLMRGHLAYQAPLAIAAVRNHPAVLCWYVCDEPDHEKWNVGADEVKLATRLLHEADPNHPTVSVVMQWAESNLYRFADSLDILATDIYPIRAEKPSDLSRIAYGTAVMRRAVGNSKPIWTVVQSTEQGTEAEHYAATYLALTEGADGILYWEFESGHKRPEVWQAILKITGELAELTPALCQEDAAEQPTASDARVHCILKSGPAGDYLIAVNESHEDAGSVALTLPQAGGGQVEVLFEGRRVPVTDAVIRDTFGGYARHVYRLAAE